MADERSRSLERAAAQGDLGAAAAVLRQPVAATLLDRYPRLLSEANDMGLKYVKPTPISLKKHPEFNEAWVQNRIKEDPTILGLGELELKDSERIHPKAGRLDLLLADPNEGRRYEVELMLGTVDESHIIRCLEYWDIERKRYPQYDHCAVLVAENITSRFLNVIGLFNSTIPLVALQMNAYTLDSQVFLTFTTVLDEIVRGDDDEDVGEGVVTDRAYWEIKAGPHTLKIVDDCYAMLKEISPQHALSYKKMFIGLTKGGRTNNFLLWKARKKWVDLRTRISDRSTWASRFDDAGVAVLNVKNANYLRLRITRPDFDKNHDLLRELFTAASKENE